MVNSVVPFSANLETITVVDLGDYVYHVILNRPKMHNAMNHALWNELRIVFDAIDKDSNCRAVILSGSGKSFCTGLDIMDFSGTLMKKHENEDPARAGRRLLRDMERMQGDITAVEKCCKPVIAAIHGFCWGGGVDLSSTCDVRYCTRDAEFSVKEVHVGLAADMGSLNRLPHIIGNHSWLKEIALTGRHFRGDEAYHYGLVSKVCDSKETLDKEVLALAREMASFSPIAVTGTKVVLNHARDHSVNDSLKFVALWNMSQLQTDDLPTAAMAVMQKQKKPLFNKL